jgi:hypothetical protein
MLEQRRDAVPVERMHPDDELRVVERFLFGGDVDVEVG